MAESHKEQTRPISFILKMNYLSVMPVRNDEEQGCDQSEEQDIVNIFTDDTTLYKVIDVSSHASDNLIGNSPKSVDSIKTRGWN